MKALAIKTMPAPFWFLVWGIDAHNFGNYAHLLVIRSGDFLAKNKKAAGEKPLRLRPHTMRTPNCIFVLEEYSKRTGQSAIVFVLGAILRKNEAQ